MKLYKKSNSKEVLLANESPVWGSGAMIYAALKR
jgi:hypothetical protein